MEQAPMVTFNGRPVVIGGVLAGALCVAGLILDNDVLQILAPSAVLLIAVAVGVFLPPKTRAGEGAADE